MMYQNNDMSVTRYILNDGSHIEVAVQYRNSTYYSSANLKSYWSDTRHYYACNTSDPTISHAEVLLQVLHDTDAEIVERHIWFTTWGRLSLKRLSW